jgi:SPOR domain
VDLARKLAPVRRSPQAQAISESDQWNADQRQPFATPVRAIAFGPGKPGGPADCELKAPQTSGFGVPCSHDPRNVGPATGRRSGRWTASALAPAGATLLFGTALFVAVFAPKGGSIGARSDIMKPALVKIVGSEERPTDLHVDTSSAATPTSKPSSAGVAPPTSVEPPATAPVAPLRPAESQSAESNPVPTTSAPPDVTVSPSAAPLDAPQGPAEAAPIVGSKIVPGAQPPTPNLDLPTKPSRKTPVRVTVAKTAATAPSAAAEMRRQPQRPGPSMISPAPAGPQTIAAPAAAQEPVSPVSHVFGALAGALGASAVDQTASKSGDWAIQFAAPKSEAEAEVAAARLNAKYGPALNGATIGVHKTQVNGETIYALRVAGLSKADATALCVRVKGRDCSNAK